MIFFCKLMLEAAGGTVVRKNISDFPFAKTSLNLNECSYIGAIMPTRDSLALEAILLEEPQRRGGL